MVKKRKPKRKPRKRTSRPAPSASRPPRRDGAAPAAPTGEGEDAALGSGGGLASRSLLLDALGGSSRPPSAGGAGERDAEEAPSAEPEEPASPGGDDEQPFAEYREEEAEPDADADEEQDEEDEQDEDEEQDEDDEQDEEAAQLGATRYVIAGFFAAWLVSAYVLAQALKGVWSFLAIRDWFVRSVPTLAAVPHEGQLVSRSSVSLVLGGLIAGIVVLIYYRKPDVRTWADEVAEQLGKVNWPTRKEVSNHTVVVLAVGAVLTLYLSLLDRFWGFLTNLIYTSGV